MHGNAPVSADCGKTTAFFSEVLRRMDTQLSHVIQEKKAVEGDQAWGGLYVSESEVRHLLHSEAKNSAEGSGTSDRWYACELPSHPRFERMAQICHLNRLDQWIFLAAIAPLLDAKYARIYGYLHDNMGRSSASLYICYLLFAESLEDRITILGRLSEDAPLIRLGLLRSAGSDRGQESISIHPAIFDFLIGAQPVEIQGFPVRCAQENRSAEFHDSGQTMLPDENVVYCLGGGSPYESYRHVCQMADQQGWSLVEVDAAELKTHAPADKSASLEILFLSAALYESVVCMRRFDLLLNDGIWFQAIQRILGRASPSIQWVLTGNGLMDSYHHLSQCFPDKRLFELNSLMPTYEARRQRWLNLLPPHLIENADMLAGRLEFTLDEISQTIRAAQDSAHQGEISLDDLMTGARHRRGVPSSIRLQHVQTPFDWPDLILPEKCLMHLRQIESHMLYLEKVRREWGFARRIPKQGLSVMFCGDSGVGKTMSAAIIARSLKIDLYRVDISQVVSKYIGETEKNIAEVFDAAEFSGAALFFDEADALFSKRTEINDSHDRYANLETSFLLQKMEEFGGLTILASNLRQNIDSAFLRRIHSIVEFPFPAARERRRMWESMFPDATPLGDDIDFDWLSNNVVLSGGHLHHVILEASIQAMAENQEVCMKHIEHAVSREYEKLQKTSVTIDWPSDERRDHSNHRFADPSVADSLLTGGSRR
jgi:hypothetical protein